MCDEHAHYFVGGRNPVVWGACESCSPRSSPSQVPTQDGHAHALTVELGSDPSPIRGGRRVSYFCGQHATASLRRHPLPSLASSPCSTLPDHFSRHHPPVVFSCILYMGGGRGAPRSRRSQRPTRGTLIIGTASSASRGARHPRALVDGRHPRQQRRHPRRRHPRPLQAAPASSTPGVIHARCGPSVIHARANPTGASRPRGGPGTWPGPRRGVFPPHVRVRVTVQVRTTFTR